MAANYTGRVGLKVAILDKSPFGGQKRQETVQYLSKSNFNVMDNRVAITYLPENINGFRNAETQGAEDNFLTDGSTYLEDAFYDTEATFIDEEGEESTQTVQTPADSASVAKVKAYSNDDSDSESSNANVNAAGNSSASSAQNVSTTSTAKTGDQSAAGSSSSSENSAAKKEYFTWETSEALVIGYQARPFTEPPTFDGLPSWTYASFPKPGGARSNVITPFQKKNPNEVKQQVHWGCFKRNPIAKNQPFEMTYYYCERDMNMTFKPSAKANQYNQFNFQNKDGNPLDIDLSTSIYFGFECGVGTEYHFLFLFINGRAPYLFKVDRPIAKLVDAFEQLNNKTIFDQNHKHSSISVEPVAGHLIVRSNMFSDTPWIIYGTETAPLLIEKGPLVVYGGNIQAGFSFQPVTYQHSASFDLPPLSFNIVSKGEGSGSKETVPTITTALKGSGSVEQARTYNSSGSNSKAPKDPEIHMVDCEEVNGKKITSVVLQQTGMVLEDSGTTRKINISISEKEASDKKAAPAGSSAARKYTGTIKMTASDVPQPGGYVVKDGRAPYIWMIRAGVEPDPTDGPQEVEDIACDVMQIDLTCNATSYNEITHTGTIRVLNRNNPSKKDYKSYMNRTVYLRIYAGWENCPHDGGGVDKIFEGLTVGYDVTTDASQEVVIFKIEDYMSVLQAMKFQLCPIYDGMSATLAVKDIVQMTGLPESKIYADGKPVSEANLSNDYVLGGNLQTPLDGKYRFKNDTSLKDGLLTIAKLDFKTIYFDNEGNFHYDTMPGGPLGDSANESITKEFYSSYNTGASSPWQLVWNQVGISRNVKDVYNAILVMTVDALNPLPIIKLQDVNRAGQDDPSSEGYLGYVKPLIISDAFLGSSDAAAKYLDAYRKRVYIPPLTARFESYGTGGIRPLMITKLDGTPVRLLNITTKLNAKEGVFWHSYEGEWFFISNKGQDSALSPSQAGSGGGGSSAGSTSSV